MVLRRPWLRLRDCLIEFAITKFDIKILCVPIYTNHDDS